MLGERTSSQTCAWELPKVDELDPRISNPLLKRQFSMKSLLIAMCLLGTGLGVVAQAARWIKTGMTPVKWQSISVATVNALATEKRCVVVTGYDGGWSSFDESLRQIDIWRTRLALDRNGCTAYVINSSSDHATLQALKKRFPAPGLGVAGDFKVLLIENGEPIKWCSSPTFSVPYELERICEETRLKTTAR